MTLVAPAAAWSAPEGKPVADGMPAAQPILGPDEALVYIQRTSSAVMMLRSAGFSIDKIKFASLGNNTCTALIIKSGAHVLSQKWAIDISYGRSLSQTVDWSPGRTYFYRFSTGMSASGYPVVRFQWSLEEADPTLISSSTAKCHYQPPQNVEKFGGRALVDPS